MKQMKKSKVTKEMLESVLTLEEMRTSIIGWYINPITNKRFNVTFNDDNTINSIVCIKTRELNLISHYGFDFEYVKSLIK